MLLELFGLHSPNAAPTGMALARDWVQTLSVVFAIAWASWTWGFSEWLRKKDLLPALDGTIETSVVGNSDDRSVVTISSEWGNKGKIPVYLNAETSAVEIYEVILGSPAIIGDANIKLLFTSNLLEDFEYFFLEPGTLSPIQASVVLESRRFYLARLSLQIDVERQRNLDSSKTYDGVYWKREIVFQT